MHLAYNLCDQPPPCTMPTLKTEKVKLIAIEAVKTM